MKLLNKLFGKTAPKQAKSLGEQAQELSAKLIVSVFRRIAREKNCAPTDKISDEKIIQIYEQVGSAFREVAESRSERIPAGNLNAIVFKFIQVYEMSKGMGLKGDNFYEKHLKYEIEKYQNEGLREDYRIHQINLI